MSDPPVTCDAASSEQLHSLDAAVVSLANGAEQLRGMSLDSRRELVDACAERTARYARPWVEVACRAKHIDPNEPLAAEEILAGPSSLLRYLQILSSVFLDAQHNGVPSLPGKPRRDSRNHVRVPVLPVSRLYDSILFMGLKAEVCLRADANEQSLFSDSLLAESKTTAKIAGVLGAGNVSAIPLTDTLYKIFHEREAVLLKLNPVNEYLEPVFCDILRPLIDADLLRIVRGGREIGDAIVQHPDINTLHLTGSHLTHDAIVWGTDRDQQAERKQRGQPLVTKPVTSELGNVTPWIVVPGSYSKKQLRSQAEHLVASIVNNASFNCVATKIIITSKNWPQRDEFLDLLESLLKSVPPRFAYYPGAEQRFTRATGNPPNVAKEGYLPWTLMRDANPDTSPHLFEEESFVCVCAETALDQSTPVAFLQQAVEFANDRLFGTLCATLTLPNDFQTNHAESLDLAIEQLHYGSVCINQWAGIVYGMMTPPWGGAPGTSLAYPQSGIGCVHNAFFLEHVEKTILRGPLCNPLKPVWFPSHRTAHKVAWNLLDLYKRPSLRKLLPLTFNAMRG